jgi:hypothetical protein
MHCAASQKSIARSRRVCTRLAGSNVIRTGFYVHPEMARIKVCGGTINPPCSTGAFDILDRQSRKNGFSVTRLPRAAT